ncbi:MAG: hypothetical protein JWM69_198 [Candidatus Binatus sp.]|jgi:hypothetical protein|nr:hypothetical protein [Candidatus Binatus sp.]
MRKLTALLAGATLAFTALPAVAGVLITQKQNVTNGTNTRDTEQTVMVQGNKQKMVTERHTIITDLDKGMMYVIDPKEKTYFEIEFPPKGQMAAMMAASAAAAMNFKKADSTREIAGYKCHDYNGGGHMMAGDYTIKECFSKDAPGAAEFATFEKNMASKLKGAGANSPPGGEMPDGVPLASDSSMKMGNVSIPGMSPEQAAKINQMMAGRPPVVTKTVVTKIEAKKLDTDTFAIPSGFTKKELPQGPAGGGMGGMHMAAPKAGGPPAAGASPAAH